MSKEFAEKYLRIRHADMLMRFSRGFLSPMDTEEMHRIGRYLNAIDEARIQLKRMDEKL